MDDMKAIVFSPVSCGKIVVVEAFGRTGVLPRS